MTAREARQLIPRLGLGPAGASGYWRQLTAICRGTAGLIASRACVLRGAKPKHRIRPQPWPPWHRAKI